jgi:hypothetical protein
MEIKNSDDDLTTGKCVFAFITLLQIFDNLKKELKHHQDQLANFASDYIINPN